MTPLSPNDRPLSSLSPSQHRAALALAEAILPSAYGVPGADVDTVAAAEQYVAWMGKGSPLAVKLWGAALKALDTAAVLTTGRRFADLGRVGDGRELDESLGRQEHQDRPVGHERLIGPQPQRAGL